MEVSNIDKGSEPLSPDNDDDEFVIVSESDIATTYGLKELSEELHENCDDESIENQILKIEKDFKHWTKLRRTTISNLREIAEYIGKFNRGIQFFIVLFRSADHFYM